MRNAPILSLLLLAISACTSAPEAPPRLPIELSIRYAPRGGVMLGPRTSNTIEQAPTRLAVTVLDCEAVPGATPVDTLAEAILADTGRPFRAGSELLRGIGWVPHGDLVANGRLATTTGLVSGDFVTRISAPGSGLPDLLVVQLGENLGVGLRTAGAGTAEGDPTKEEQLAMLRPLPPSTNGTVTLLQREPGSDHAVAVVLHFGQPGTASAMAEVHAQLLAASQVPPLTDPGERPTDLARDAVGEVPRRHALLAVAQKYELQRCLDLTLCLGERELIAIADALPHEPTTAWDIERTFWQGILPAMQRGELSPGAEVCVRRHFGCVGLDPSALEFALQTSATVEQFEGELLDDNLRALDARRARQRVDAALWLAATGHAIADYDPLAPRAQRKAAIRQHEQMLRRQNATPVQRR